MRRPGLQIGAIGLAIAFLTYFTPLPWILNVPPVAVGWAIFGGMGVAAIGLLYELIG